MRTTVVLLLLGVTAALVLHHPPVDLAAGQGALAACPGRFGAWNGSEAVLEELRADDVLVRRYVRGGEVAWLTVVVHRHRRYGAHDPVVCYESQGYAVRSLGRRRLPDGSPAGLEVNVFRADRPRETRLVYYWWSSPGLTTADAGRMRERMALAGALDHGSWGAFVRAETRLGPGGIPAARAGLDDFSGRVARALPGLFATDGGERGG